MLTGLLLLLAVQQTSDGVLFQCQTNGARIVYLAGDFNEWARNEAGRITNPAFAMTASNGVWRKVVKLDPGTYRFKFNINGEPDRWFAPDSIDERDADGNAIFRVKPDGAVVVRSARNPKWKPQRTEQGVLFQFFAPDAFIVYLAGDFNNWANNRAGLVFDPQCAMDGPDADGLWRKTILLPPGRHLYQFVIDGDRWLADPNAEANDNENHSVLIVK
jgi:1,4-alpha-glucan branching enzyme